MKLVHGDLSGEIVNEQKECVEWIIESPELFSKYVGELYKPIKMKVNLYYRKIIRKLTLQNIQRL